MGSHDDTRSTISSDDAHLQALMLRVARVTEVTPSARWTPRDGHAGKQLVRGRADLPEIGSVVDERYRIESLLGEGGMGVVYAARALRTDREVALKYMIGRPLASDDPSRDVRLERFVREARAAGRVRHPNVVDIYDAGGNASAPYLVMERLHGESLAARMARGTLSVDEALHWVLEAAHGVAAAHKQGVIHRDLKPENLFLADQQGHAQPVAKVLDFGVSRIIDPALELAPLTRSGLIVGTPAYMPLEQMRAEREVDARADVYALGSILYEAVSGRRPYKANSLHDLLLCMATQEATPVSESVPDAPAWFTACLAKCLARDPDQRFVDAQEMLDAFESRRAPQPAGVSGLQRPRWHPRRVVWLLGCVAVFAAWLCWRVTAPAAQPAARRVAPARAPSPAMAAEPPTAESAATADIESGPTELRATKNGPAPAPVQSTRTQTVARPQRLGTSRTGRAARARDLRPEDF